MSLKGSPNMAQNYRYISGDSHLEIDAKWWVGRVPQKYRDQAPRLVRLPDGSDAWAIEGQPLRQVPFDLYGGKSRHGLSDCRGEGQKILSYQRSQYNSLIANTA